MGKVFNKQNKPGPGIKHSEIEIPDDQNLGTGTFTTVLEPTSVAKDQPIISMIVNPPSFQLSVNINPQTKEIPVLIGKADGSDPLSNKLFSLPDNIELKEEYVFEAKFDHWDIVSLKMNETPLLKKIRPGTITFWFDPLKNKGAFTNGVNVNWGEFDCNGEICTIFSEGKILIAYLNKNTADETMVFSRELEVDISKSHMVAITWNDIEMTLYFDGEEESKYKIKIVKNKNS